MLNRLDLDWMVLNEDQRDAGLLRNDLLLHPVGLTPCVIRSWPGNTGLFLQWASDGKLRFLGEDPKRDRELSVTLIRAFDLIR